METRGGVKLTRKQVKNIKDLQKVLETWDKDLAINCIAGTLYVMLLGDTEQNPIPEMSDTGGFNPKNVAYIHTERLSADGGDW